MAKQRRSGVIRPSLFWFLLLDGGIVALAYLVFNQEAYDQAAERSGGQLPGRDVLQGMLIGTAVIHLAEALVAGRMARKRGLRPGVWRRQTFVVGFPSLLALRKAGRPA